MSTTNCTPTSREPTNNGANKTSILVPSQPPSFHPFPRLPTELRLKIWSSYHDLSPPRKLRFSYRTGGANKPPRALEGNSSSHGFSVPRHEIPPILHICRESRDFALPFYSLIKLVPQSSLLCQRAIRNALEEIGYEEVMRSGVRIQGIFWNKRKDIMWIDDYWLDDNLSAFYWGGRFDVKFPGVRWVVFDEGTTVSFVQEKVINWSGVEVIFVLRPFVGWDSRMKREERTAWEKRFGTGEGEEKGAGMERGTMPELQIVESWKDVLEYLHRRGVW